MGEKKAVGEEKQERGQEEKKWRKKKEKTNPAVSASLLTLCRKREKQTHRRALVTLRGRTKITATSLKKEYYPTESRRKKLERGGGDRAKARPLGSLTIKNRASANVRSRGSRSLPIYLDMQEDCGKRKKNCPRTHLRGGIQTECL